MKLNKSFLIWWGPPKEFVTSKSERRVSWLELFYDLVYVIAIAHITHQFAHHLSFHGFFEYVALFALIYWGWLNGSLHHDLHGNQGLRTRLMMLWQMMIIAALAIVLDKPDLHHTHTTIVFMIMQLFITYQWWSVGLYDKVHRKYSWPYTVLFLLSVCLMGLSLWVPHHWTPYLICIILVCNYAPPFIANRLLARVSMNLNLSSSMFERLGLFTIIIFGELVIGVVNGIGNIEVLTFIDWINFAIGIAIVFALWWVFFVLVSQREVQDGFNKASLLELLYIPALVSLGVIATCFSSFFVHMETIHHLQQLFGISVAVFFICIFLIMGLLVYPSVFKTIKRPMRISLLITATVFFILAFMNLQLSITKYLIMVLVILIIEISYLNFVYYRTLLKEGIDPLDVK